MQVYSCIVLQHEAWALESFSIPANNCWTAVDGCSYVKLPTCWPLIGATIDSFSREHPSVVKHHWIKSTECNNWMYNHMHTALFIWGDQSRHHQLVWGVWLWFLHIHSGAGWGSTKNLCGSIYQPSSLAHAKRQVFNFQSIAYHMNIRPLIIQGNQNWHHLLVHVAGADRYKCMVPYFEVPSRVVAVGAEQSGTDWSTSPCWV